MSAEPLRVQALDVKMELNASTLLDLISKMPPSKFKCSNIFSFILLCFLQM